MPVFLRAEWRHLAMLNYEIAPEALAPCVPRHTELDTWNGKTMVSIVGFLFQGTRVLGMPIPYHINFEEVNLRFYVRHKGPEGWRRGVVFIREIVPRQAIARVARSVYNEPYVALPMRHAIEARPKVTRVTYEWRHDGRWSAMHIESSDALQVPSDNSEAAFIAEHYWGYTRQRDGGTAEYAVEHPRWRTMNATSTRLDCNAEKLYGKAFAVALQQNPSSAFLAEGSAVAVRRGRRLNE